VTFRWPGTDGTFALVALSPAVTQDGSGPARLIEALSVVRNAKIGFGIGVGLAAVMYAYRVAELGGPVSATRGSPALFLMLAVVLAVSAGALVTVALTLRSAIRLAREME
jgi:hypothetical protein